MAATIQPGSSVVILQLIEVRTDKIYIYLQVEIIKIVGEGGMLNLLIFSKLHSY